MTLEEILQQFFGCKKPFLKTKRVVGHCPGGEPDYEYMTESGARAYENLVNLLYALGPLLEMSDEVHRMVSTLDEITTIDG